MINVLLVEDHELYRMGLSMLLNKTEGINLISEASDGYEGLKKAREFMPDVILMDIGLPGMDGIESTARIKDFLPETRIIMLTARNGEQDVLSAFSAGADGYVMKGATPEQTIASIKAVNEGVGWIDPAIAKIVFKNLGRSFGTNTSGTENPDRTKNTYGLTERELDVLELMVEGLTNPQIAEKLIITRATAKAHVHSILQKLCSTSRTQATVKAINEGLL